jgi:hypothetical protein
MYLLYIKRLMHTHMLHSSRLFLSPLDMREERKSHEKQIVERKYTTPEKDITGGLKPPFTGGF